jgi:hypothetical protein
VIDCVGVATTVIPLVLFKYVAGDQVMAEEGMVKVYMVPSAGTSALASFAVDELAVFVEYVILS